MPSGDRDRASSGRPRGSRVQVSGGLSVGSSRVQMTYSGNFFGSAKAQAANCDSSLVGSSSRATTESVT